MSFFISVTVKLNNNLIHRVNDDGKFVAVNISKVTYCPLHKQLKTLKCGK